MPVHTGLIEPSDNFVIVKAPGEPPFVFNVLLLVTAANTKFSDPVYIYIYICICKYINAYICIYICLYIHTYK
jgi:hypothetical protein